MTVNQEYYILSVLIKTVGGTLMFIGMWLTWGPAASLVAMGLTILMPNPIALPMSRQSGEMP